MIVEVTVNLEGVEGSSSKAQLLKDALESDFKNFQFDSEYVPIVHYYTQDYFSIDVPPKKEDEEMNDNEGILNLTSTTV